MKARNTFVLVLCLPINYILYLYWFSPKETCPFPPVPSRLQRTNEWQTQKTTKGTLQLRNAYLDDRKSNLVVRIVAMLNTKHPPKIFCQIFYNNKFVIAQADFQWIWKSSWLQEDNFYQPYLISCDINDSQIPVSVSLVEDPCETTTNNLDIAYTKQAKQDFVVCVKGLNFPHEDISLRLVEWIELNRILGASKIHFYRFFVHSNVQKVLDYYTKKSIIDFTPITLVGDEAPTPNLTSTFLKTEKVKRRLQETIPYTDCLYKYLHKARYILCVDTDEIVMPANGTWTDLMQNLHSRYGELDSYVARNAYFFDQFQTSSGNIPEYMHILRHVTRSRQFSAPGDFVKGFHDTERVITVFNHLSLRCFGFWGCTNQDIDLDLAHLQHYRGDCVQEVTNCEELKRNVVEDKSVWRFKEELIARVEEVVKILNFQNIQK